MKHILILFLACFAIMGCGTAEDDLFENIPDTYPVLKKVLDNPDTYRTQIIYTRIERDSANNIEFKNHTYNLDDDAYFYPASTVKLPVAALALEWLNEQQLTGLDKETILKIDAVRPSQTSALQDSTSEDGNSTIAHYIKKILLVSDNDAYNRLYELLGQDYINSKMRDKGMRNTVINHRLSMPMSPEENRYFNPMRFEDEDGKVIYEIPARQAESTYINTENPTIGKAYLSKGEKVEEPMDFTDKNKYALSDFHGTVQRLVFPEKFQTKDRFNITEEDRIFLLTYMGILPGESDYPKYDLPDYYDSYSKFFKFGTDKNPMPAHIRIFNKTGNAYGQLLDGSYFVDFEAGVEFFVSAVIYTNANETLNDDNYEYDQIGFPFFAELGEYLYQLELKREKEVKPDLSLFRGVTLTY